MRRIRRNGIVAWIERDFVESNHDNAAVTKPFRERQRSVNSVTTHDPWQWWMRRNWFLFLVIRILPPDGYHSLDDCFLLRISFFLFF